MDLQGQTILGIGDTHGRKTWETILEKETYDHVNFVGDYFDSKDNISAAEQIYNFKNILAAKKAHPDHITLHIGNHDFHYMRGQTQQQYSGFQHGPWPAIQYELIQALDQELLTMAWQAGNVIFTHAGVTKRWLEDNEVITSAFTPGVTDIAKIVNDIFKYTPNAFRFKGPEAHGGNITESPIWVRTWAFKDSQLPGYVQVFGHTQVDKIDIRGKSTGCKYFGIDNIDKGGYIKITNGKFTLHNVKDLV